MAILINSGNPLFRIHSSKMKFGIMAGDQRYLNFFWSLIIQAFVGILINDSITGQTRTEGRSE